MPDAADVGAVPFAESIRFLREKVHVPTERWDDLRGRVHAKAFTVAGATRAALLSDLHAAITHAIENGESIGSFRNRFDAIAEEHGWTYNGPRGWRTRVIYDTNLRTAHMAGRWEQIDRVRSTRPYLMYLTVGDERVRDEHRQWHELVLRSDDDWWDTHYPPNGWGCRCYVRTLSQRQLDREGRAVAAAPAIQRTERVNTRSGEILGEVPEGIDTGWDYNVGKAWLGPEQGFTAQLLQLPPLLAQPAVQQWLTTPALGRWLEQPEGDIPVAVLDGVLVGALGAGDPIVRLSADTMAKQLRQHPEMTAAEYAVLPDIVANGRALQDSDQSVVLIRSVGRRRVAVVKVTQSRKATFLASFRRLDRDRELARLESRGQLLREERE